MIALAMRILSVVPNSAATERTFSLMGIIHTDHRNWLDPERVRKAVLVRSDIDRKHGHPNWKRKHSNMTLHDSSERTRPHVNRPSSQQPAGLSHGSNTLAGQLEDEAVDSPDAVDVQYNSFSAVAQEMACQAEEYEREVGSTRIESSGSMPAPTSDDRLLCNLFRLPGSDDYTPLTSFFDFWQVAQQYFDAELAMQDSIASSNDS